MFKKLLRKMFYKHECMINTQNNTYTERTGFFITNYISFGCIINQSVYFGDKEKFIQQQLEKGFEVKII